MIKFGPLGASRGPACTSSVHRAPGAVRATSRPYALSAIVTGVAGGEAEPAAVAAPLTAPSGAGAVIAQAVRTTPSSVAPSLTPAVGRRRGRP